MNYQLIKGQFNFNTKQAEIMVGKFITNAIKEPLIISYTEDNQPIKSNTINYVIGFQTTVNDKYQLTIATTNFTGTLKMVNQVKISTMTMMVQEIIAKYQKYLSFMLTKLDLALYKGDFDTLSQFSTNEFDLVPLTVHQLVEYLTNNWEQYIIYNKQNLLLPILSATNSYLLLVSSLLKLSVTTLQSTANEIISLLRYGISHHLCTDKEIMLTQELLNKLNLNRCLLSMSTHRQLLRLLLSEPRLSTDFVFNVNDLAFLDQNFVIASLNQNTSTLRFKVDAKTTRKMSSFTTLMSLVNHPKIEYTH